MAEISDKETQQFPKPPHPIADQPTIAMQAPTTRRNNPVSNPPPVNPAPQGARNNYQIQQRVERGNTALQPKKKGGKLLKTGGKESAQLHLLRDRCKQIGLSLFVDTRIAVQSLGITSAIEGEGKTFLSLLIAQGLAEEGFAPVTLVDCNWQHPNLHEYFSIRPAPGLAEWLRGECDETEIRQQVGQNLSIIPAGDGDDDAVRLLRQLRAQGLRDSLARGPEVLVIDLPSILTTAYGTLAAGLPEALLLVTRGGVTPAPLLAETIGQLEDLPVKSIVLNQIESKIPRWIRQLL
jgi:Mrp family chromosome partitioning ATPase